MIEWEEFTIEYTLLEDAWVKMFGSLSATNGFGESFFDYAKRKLTK